MSKFLHSKLDVLVPYTPGEQPKNNIKWIKLNTNESPFPPAKGVIEGINNKEVSDLRLYSDPTCDNFLTELAKSFGVEKSQVFPSNGSDEVLAFAFMGLCEKGAAFSDLTYGFYPIYCDLFAVKKTIVPLREDFSLEVEDYKDIEGTIFIVNPNAPTGKALSLEKISQLLEQNLERLVVVDEAYVDFGGESSVKLLDKYSNLLIIGTFSKSRSLAGARLGYAVGSSEIINDLNKIRFSFNPYNVNRLTLVAGTEALKDEAYFKDCIEKIISNREYASEKLRELNFQVVDSKTNFILVKCPTGISGEEYYNKLKDVGILVRFLSSPRLREYVRISIGTIEEMEILIKETKKILEGLV